MKISNGMVMIRVKLWCLFCLGTFIQIRCPYVFTYSKQIKLTSIMKRGYVTQKLGSQMNWPRDAISIISITVRCLEWRGKLALFPTILSIDLCVSFMNRINDESASSSLGLLFWNELVKEVHICIFTSTYQRDISDSKNISSNPGFEWQLRYYSK